MVISMQIEQGTKVKLHFSLALEDGSLIDSNFDKQPASFIIGDGNLLPGFESAILGLESGQKREFTIPPENAFGQHNPQNVQDVDRTNFAEDKLEIGAVFSFQNGDGELPGVIIGIEGEKVMIDFNHPLAGQSILFKVEILQISPESVH
ncbi:FKBP-type peptidyl-prolyl cis-trans isomerase [Porticoccaceae bacterium]|nr:FKBP-type peptidyl-prolyl cis-trans isomerase [Porticoccaceae bacterium]MDB2343397.1 FKBP-type peptidyl-prolyl cis-trans isomerase [Porticoccaceae bacterium]MDB2486729.1 FKBP-type peptidyl-prolyl cis-trans isomerase [Porticoccaceae bacterium]